ncbi:MAG: biuret amidohydrolase [Solirubrobacteraceae bacterium]|nr:biuret amidohydrolase [Solirubrobacteraceae bacterium]
MIVIDVQKGELTPERSGIPIMPGAPARHRLVREIVDAARFRGVPVVFVQEVHKPSLADFGRELDGTEGVHCLEGDPATELADGLDPRPEEYLIRKRRYSAFFATEFELVLKSLGVSTLVLVGALTDVCVHYTFADAHQHDYHVRVVTDCVGGSSREAHDAALRAMEYLQRDCLVTAADVLDVLARPTDVGVAA